MTERNNETGEPLAGYVPADVARAVRRLVAQDGNVKLAGWVRGAIEDKLRALGEHPDQASNLVRVEDLAREVALEKGEEPVRRALERLVLEDAEEETPLEVA